MWSTSFVSKCVTCFEAAHVGKPCHDALQEPCLLGFDLINLGGGGTTWGKGNATRPEASILFAPIFFLYIFSEETTMVLEIVPRRLILTHLAVDAV